MKASSYNLPVVYSTFPNAFASREDYLAFVAAWKQAYKCLALTLRLRKLESRENSLNPPAKAAHLAQAIARTKVSLTALGDCPYIAAGVGRYGLPFRAAEATWLLELRAAAKMVAGRQRAERLAALAPR